mgnify:CR=1 FL=1
MDNAWYDHEIRERCDQKDLKKYSDRLPKLEPSLCPDFDAYLTSRNLNPDIERANLWYPSRYAGDDAPRIVIPASSSDTYNKFWQARLMATEGISSLVRYQSPHGCRSGDAVIVVYPELLNRPYRSVVVEGPMDALAAAGEGCLGIALMGALPPQERIDLTATLVRGTIAIICYDSDNPAALVAVMSQLSNLGVQCRLRDPSPAKDLAELNRAQRAKLLSD